MLQNRSIFVCLFCCLVFTAKASRGPFSHPECRDLLEKTKNQEELARIKNIYESINQKKFFNSINNTSPTNRESALLYCTYYGKSDEIKKIINLYPQSINAIDTQERSILHILINGLAAFLFGIHSKYAEMPQKTTLKEWHSLFRFILSHNINSSILHSLNQETLLQTITDLQKHSVEFKNITYEQQKKVDCTLEKMFIESLTDFMVHSFLTGFSNEKILETIHLSIKNHSALEKKYYQFVEQYMWNNFFFTAIRKSNLRLVLLLLQKDPFLAFATYTLENRRLSPFEYHLNTSRDPKIGDALISKSFFYTEPWALEDLHNLFKKILFKQIHKNDFYAVKTIIKNIPEAIDYTKEKNERTPLHYAAKNRLWRTSVLLIKNGAKLEIMDIFGVTPLAYFFGKGKTLPFDTICNIDPTVTRKNIFPQKTMQRTHCFVTLCRKYLFALSPHTPANKLTLTKKQQKLYGYYFTKTPLQSFSKQFKKK